MKRFLSLIIILLFVQIGLSAQTDSLGIEREGDKIFVLHKVQAKQTLYSLARRYMTSVKEINAENPTLSTGLQVGQTLRIPYGGEMPSEKPEVETAIETTMHEVVAGETLFSIAQQYEVSVNDLRNWNNLETNALSLGQSLEIRKEIPADQAAPASQQTTQADTAQEAIEYGGTPLGSQQTEGVAEVIEEEEPSSKFFALHRTAKKGTVIKVTNVMNDITVYVRVIGTIPETTANEGILIKVNQRAYEYLKAVDKRFRVELSYFQ